MGKKKIVQNYELLEQVGQVDGMYEIYKAKHIEERKNYTIKKVKTKNDKNNRLSLGFMNEAGLLKNLKHPNIARSIKMMKTATTIYVVYDYCAGQNLQEWMEKGSKRTLSQKQNVIKQLCIVIAQFKKAGISHLYLNPECIYVSEQGDVKVTDFMYGINMPDTEEAVELYDKVPKNDFTSPQVRKGTACYESDIYSFGKIIQFMEVADSKRGTFTLKEFNAKCEELNEITKTATKKRSYERDPIEEVYKIFYKTKGKLKKMKSMSMSLSKIGGKESMLSRTSIISTTTNKQKAQFTQQLILKILKRRNIARLLIELFKNAVQSNYPTAADMLIFVTLLLKKSTIILNSIGKFMKYGKGIQGLDLNQKQRNKFFKSGDYAKMQPLIEADVKVQKKQFQIALESIYLDNVKILQNKKFNLQLKKEQIDESYFRQVMLNFVQTSVQEMDLEAQHTNFLRSVYIVSLILDHGSIQLFFEKKINNTPTDLIEQTIFIKIYKQMGVKELIAQLQKYRSVQPAQG